MITGIHHCALAVTDPERAARFYRDVLGLRQIEIPVTFVRAAMDVRWFALGDHQQLHLLVTPEADAPGRRHVALEVTDARAARERLRALGEDIRETVPIPGADRFFVYDPDGNRIELIEWRAPDAPS